MAERSLLDRLLRRPTGSAKPQPVAKQRISRGGGPRAEYDGATFGRRAAGWRRKQRDANGELSPAVMAALRGIARDLVRAHGGDITVADTGKQGTTFRFTLPL